MGVEMLRGGEDDHTRGAGVAGSAFEKQSRKPSEKFILYLATEHLHVALTVPVAG